jgi:hypothetical protein
MLPSGLLKAMETLPILQTLLAPAPVRAPREELDRCVEELCEKAMQAGGSIARAASFELFRGGLFYALDALDPAHAIFQEDSSPEGAYWHGMLHRREGDFWNSKYWLQRAGRLPALAGIPEFEPVQFVNRCERAAQRAGARDPEDLLDLQRLEWEHLLWAAYEKAFQA